MLIATRSPAGFEVFVHLERLPQSGEVCVTVRAAVLDQAAASLLGVFAFLFAN
jgi:hypothetical protein